MVNVLVEWIETLGSNYEAANTIVPKCADWQQGVTAWNKVDANWIKLYSDGGMERWDNQKTKQWK